MEIKQKNWLPSRTVPACLATSSWTAAVVWWSDRGSCGCSWWVSARRCSCWSVCEAGWQRRPWAGWALSCRGRSGDSLVQWTRPTSPRSCWPSRESAESSVWWLERWESSSGRSWVAGTLFSDRSWGGAWASRLWTSLLWGWWEALW